jgi:hypothetical protein
MKQKPPERPKFDFKITKDQAMDACQVLLNKAGFSDDVIADAMDMLGWECEAEPDEEEDGNTEI